MVPVGHLFNLKIFSNKSILGSFIYIYKFDKLFLKFDQYENF